MLIRSWEFRQRRHAFGAWFLFRRALADASAVLVVSRETAKALIEDGFPEETGGAGLEPPKVVVRVPSSRAMSLPSARSVPIRLEGDLLSAEGLVLVPFEPGSGAP
jgi:hypothetical protein